MTPQHQTIEMESLPAISFGGAGSPSADQPQVHCIMDGSADHEQSRCHLPESVPAAVQKDEQAIEIQITPTAETFREYDGRERLLAKLRALVEPKHNISPPLGHRLMDGKIFADGLSPVFARDLCWNIQYGDPDSLGQEPLVPWPSSEEFACYGADRARIGLRRYLPLPREDRLAKGFDPNQAVYNDDATLSAQFRHIELGRLYLDMPRQRTPRNRHLLWMKRKQEMVHFTDLPCVTQELLEDIGEGQTSIKPETEMEGGAEQDEKPGGQVDQTPTKPRRGRRRFYW